jgi:hypothetical protein
MTTLKILEVEAELRTLEGIEANIALSLGDQIAIRRLILREKRTLAEFLRVNDRSASAILGEK